MQMPTYLVAMSQVHGALVVLVSVIVTPVTPRRPQCEILSRFVTSASEHPAYTTRNAAILVSLLRQMGGDFMTAIQGGDQLLGGLNFLISLPETAAAEKQGAQYQSWDQGGHYSHVGRVFAVRALGSGGHSGGEVVTGSFFASGDDVAAGEGMHLRASGLDAQPPSDDSDTEERTWDRRKSNRIQSLESQKATKGPQAQLNQSVYAEFLQTGTVEAASRADSGGGTSALLGYGGNTVMSFQPPSGSARASSARARSSAAAATTALGKAAAALKRPRRGRSTRA